MKYTRYVNSWKKNQECDVKPNRSLVSIVLLHSHKTVVFFYLHIFPHQTEKMSLHIKIVTVDQIWAQALFFYFESSKVHDWLMETLSLCLLKM